MVASDYETATKRTIEGRRALSKPRTQSTGDPLLDELKAMNHGKTVDEDLYQVIDQMGEGEPYSAEEIANPA